MLSALTKQAVHIAQNIAKENRHGDFSSAHMLKALMHNEIGLSAALASWGKDVHYIKEWADMRISQHDKATQLNSSPEGDDSIKKLIEVSDMARLKLGQDQLSPEAILATMCKPNIAFSEDQLKSFPLTENEILQSVLNDVEINTAVFSDSDNGKVNQTKRSNKSDLYKYCKDKTALAEEGKLDPILGRNKEIRQLLEVLPNKAHFNLAKLEAHFDVEIITQNVDDLHERANSKKITHLHGELLKVRSTVDESLVLNWQKDLVLGDVCQKGNQLRPHIVWFGEMVPMLEKAIEITNKADILIIIGTSMQVYPAASLVNYIKPNTPIYYIDPKPSISKNDFNNLTIIKDVASSGTDKLLNLLTD